MGVYNELQKMGVIEDSKFYEGVRVNFQGDLEKILFVDVTYKGNTITLYSELPYTEVPSGLAFALENTFLFAVKVPQTSGVNTSSIFAKKESSESTYETYLASENVVYTPEGIYLCRNSWKDDKQKEMMAEDISSSARTFGLRDKEIKNLKLLGARKIIDFSPFKNMCKPVSIYEMLLNSGANEVKPLTFEYGREKAYGAMYEGRAVLELNGITFTFKMWYHHQSEDYLTKEEAAENLTLSGISITREKHLQLFGTAEPLRAECVRGFEFTYDANYHTLIFGNSVYLHPVGWFGLNDPRVDALKASTEEVVNRIRVYGLEPELALQLNELGFMKLV